MTSKPQISIVIPTYNQAHLLQLALESVRKQTFSLWEAIVVNNYSSDNTVEVARGFKDERISVINYKNNGVIASARNLGIKNAQAPLIAFLDSDDLWYPKKLERCFDYFERGDIDLVCHDETLVQGGKNLMRLVYGPAEAASYSNLLFGNNCLSTSAIVVKKSILEDVQYFSDDPALITAEDYDLWLRLSQKRVRFAFLPEVLGEYTLHSSNSSGNVDRHTKAIQTVVERHYQAIEPKTLALRLLKRKKEALLAYGLARGKYKAGDYAVALRHFSLSLRLNPFSSKTYAGIGLTCMKSMSKLGDAIKRRS